MNKIKLGLSPCPNDTFIFYAMLHNKVNCEGLQFEPMFADVESLNEKAFKGELPVTKLSFHTWLYLQEKYSLLDSGAALGRGCGPLLIAKEVLSDEDLKTVTVAIPGKYTTAHLLLKLFYPFVQHKKEMVFSAIENSILTDEVKAGVIIHENRFTYEAKGLKKICDLGERWEIETHSPIPLGGIFTSVTAGKDFHSTVDRIIKSSIEYAWKNQEETMQYVKQYSQEMDVTVMQQHIDLYVNDFSLSLGTVGMNAVEIMKRKFEAIPS
ncbi:MAG: 1,4-dihydroxy-6-naphthoate synthase [Bacteroidota bacterium]